MTYQRIIWLIKKSVYGLRADQFISVIQKLRNEAGNVALGDFGIDMLLQPFYQGP